MAAIELPQAQSGQGALEVAIRAAREAGATVKAHFAGEKHVAFKGRTDIVTDVDLLAERGILDLLQREFPHFGIVTEESADIAGDSAYSWVVDPIDGTRNFAVGIPHFCVAIALARGDDLLLGVTYDPMKEELFHATRGGGAYVNDVPISVSARDGLSSSLVGFDMGYDAERGGEILKVAGLLWPGVQSVRVMGSAALGLAYAACGRLDVYFHLYLYPWDMAAGIVLVREAGGVVTDIDGGPVDIRGKRIIATNAAIHADFMRRVKG